jgi:hypothetical protein
VKYAVERTREWEVVDAEHCQFDMSGAVVFTDGPLTDRVLVSAIASGEWIAVHPVHEHEHDEDDA